MLVIASSPKKGGILHCVELAGIIYSARVDVNAANQPLGPACRRDAERKFFGVLLARQRPIGAALARKTSSLGGLGLFLHFLWAGGLRYPTVTINWSGGQRRDWH
jgi:hypothetical protein